MFADRKDAGAKLAKKLLGYKGVDAIVLGLPRGGVVVAREVARALKLPLDIIVVRKVGHPANPELAVCALDESGTMMCGDIASSLDQRLLSKALLLAQDEAQRRARLYRRGREILQLQGKIAIIVDDGVATGLTASVAIGNARRSGVSRVVFAAPVVAEDAKRQLRKLADEVIVLEPLDALAGAVGAHYAHFDQTSDETVIRLLQ